MKFRLVKEGCVKVNAYHKEGISTGDVVELEGHFAEKANNNPDFKKVATRNRKPK